MRTFAHAHKIQFYFNDFRCDAKPDCSDESDENNCAKVVFTGMKFEKIINKIENFCSTKKSLFYF